MDREAGEFWVSNPFDIPRIGENLSAYERNRLYLNLGNLSFVDVSYASGVDLDSDSRGVIGADFNRDGAADLLCTADGGGPLRLFYNRFPGTAHAIRLKLTGTKSNRAAIGARVVLHCGKRQIVRDLFPPNGFMGQAPAELLIGVGQAERIDRMRIRWPDKTGTWQEFTNVPVDRCIRITEGDNRFDAAEPLACR